MGKEYIYVGETVDKAIEKGLAELNLKEDSVKIEVVEPGSAGIFGLFKKEAKVKLVPLSHDFEEVRKVEPRIIPPTSAVPSDFVEKSKVEEVFEKAEEKIAEELKKEEEKIEEVVQKFEQVGEKEDNSSETEQQEKVSYKKEKKEDYIVKNKDSIVNYLTKIVQSMGYTDASVTFEEEGNKQYTLNITTEENTSLIIGKRGSTLNSLQFLVNNYSKKFSSHYFRINVDCDNYRENRRKTLEELAVNLAKKSKKLGRAVELEPMTSVERKIIHNALADIKNVETTSVGEEPYRHLVIYAK